MIAMALLLVASEWEVMDRRDGVTTWREVTDAALPRLRAELEIPADLFEILAVLNDVDQSCAWSPDCRAARLVRNIDDYASILYVRTACPWPVDDRDVIVQTKVVIAEDGSSARASFGSITLDEIPPVEDVVRMPRSDGEYELVRSGVDRTLARFEMGLDPGGSIPSSLVRGAVEDVPYKLLRALSRQVVVTRGKYEAFREKYDPARRRP